MAANALNPTVETLEIKKTAKRDYLTALESKAQDLWLSQDLFSIDPPALPSSSTYSSLTDASYAEIQAENPKWLGTFPYPYMNGALHLGHGFTISKIEFACGFERMLGKRALFPMGFHLTGMPIKSSADKLIREMEMFGPNFENYTEPTDDDLAATAAASSASAAASTADPAKAKKGKINAKSTGLTYQFQILELLGVKREDIKKFADTNYWGQYFPPIAKTDMNAIGARVDWRRSFTTTDINPYYDSFVRWQMNKLHALGRIKFGERYTIYSPKDDQPCMDHDRASGEAVGPQEYTAVKMEVLAWGEGVKESTKEALGGRKVFMVAATLRPETMYGQTNCYVGPTLKYGIFAVSDTEAYLITERSARNMAFQSVFPHRGQWQELTSVVGSEVVGTKVAPPFGILKEVYVLPMEGVLATKGTGVVTSVPSDSPDDYATLMDLRKKAEFYKIKPEWAQYDPIAVLSTPKYGGLLAPALIAEFKIASQKDTKQLLEAKDIAYKEGFNNGTMLVGDFKGMSVVEAKPKVREQLIQSGLAFAYAEPESLVMSRSADECVVALCDQWYLDYGVEDWRAIAKTLLSRMNTYFPETRHAFSAVLDWLNQWACARSYGLGSKLPWDPQFLVESLSDSTIYMSYYTVAQLLHEGDIYGHKTGPLGITPEEMTDEVWEYVLGSGAFPSASSIPQEKAAQLKYSFNYFYPMDVRSSGKDLIPNHLTFCVYVHAALFKEEHWPKSMRANGHLMLNGKKMAKSTGNFLTLGEAVRKFGADATRLTLADSGDDIVDANFEELTANAAILRLHTACEWAVEQKEARSKGELRTGEWNEHDKLFDLEMKALSVATKAAYVGTFYKDALKSGFYELGSARDWYRELTLPENGGQGMHQDLVFSYLRYACLLSQPIVPHFAEFLWREILDEPTSVQTALWPEVTGPVNEGAAAQLAYMRGVLSRMRGAEAQILKKKSKGKSLAGGYDPAKPRFGRLFVAASYPKWQTDVVDSMKEVWDESDGKELDDKKIRASIEKKGLIKDKRVMPFMMTMKRKVASDGASSFSRSLPYSELDTLTLLLPYIKSSMKFEELSVVSAEEALEKVAAGETGPGWEQARIEAAEPSSPEVVFWNP